MKDGSLCTGIVYIDDEDENILHTCEHGDVWTAYLNYLERSCNVKK